MAKSSPKHFFSKLASVQMPRTRFDMSHVNTTTITTDYLYPVFCEEVLPGDSWNIGVSNMVRLLTPLDVPMMDNLYMDYHFWYVPDRLVWNHLKNFFGEKPREDVDTDYVIPQIQIGANGANSGTIYDYFDIPITDGTDKVLTGTFSINALPFRAYNLIYDEWYMDEQRQDYSYYNNGDETDDSSKYFLLKRGKRFDYFTSTLLEPQLGEPVQIGLSSTAPVYHVGGNFTGKNPFDVNLGVTDSVIMPNTRGTVPQGYGPENAVCGISTPRAYTVSTLSDGSLAFQSGFDGNTSNIVSTRPHEVRYSIGGTFKDSAVGSSNSSVTQGGVIYNAMYADLQQASGITIASLRQAFQLQAYNELRARTGTRYTEYIYGQFGVISPDARLQRPEFLGGCHQRLTTMPVIQNSGTSNTSPQGTITGIVYGAQSDHGFTRSFTEHGYILGICNIYSDLTYFQGLDRKWTRKTPLDFALPIFANLTDQEVKNKELVLTGNEAEDEKTFGYAERYAEYKYSKNTLSGLVRPNAPLSVGQWSLAQQFGAGVLNNSQFITSDTPIGRVTAVSENNNHQFIVNQKFTGNVVRCLPAYSDPMKWFMRG